MPRHTEHYDACKSSINTVQVHESFKKKLTYY